MLHFSIFGYICIGILVVMFIVWGIRLSKVEKQPHEFDLTSLGKIPGPGSALDIGDPEMVGRIEKKLKKAAKK